MGLLPEINYNPSEDSMQDVFDKINGAIQTINAVLGGGSAYQGMRKASGNDFDFEFIDNGVRFEKIEIGPWNMDTTATLVVYTPAYMVYEKIIFCQAYIQNDNSGSGAQKFPIDYFDTSTAKVAGGVYVRNEGVGNTSINLGRATSGLFDSTFYNDATINRGYIIIAYID